MLNFPPPLVSSPTTTPAPPETFGTASQRMDDNGYLTFPDMTGAMGTDYTVMGWFLLENAHVNRESSVFECGDSATTNSKLYKVTYNPDSSTLTGLVRDSAGLTNTASFTLTDRGQQSGYVHVAIRIASGGAVSLFLDGVLVASDSTNNLTVFTNTSINTTVGATRDGGGTTLEADQEVHDFRIYTAALTDQQIIDIEDGTEYLTNLYARYFGLTDNYEDKEGSNDATKVGSVVQVPTGHLGFSNPTNPTTTDLLEWYPLDSLTGAHAGDVLTNSTSPVTFTQLEGVAGQEVAYFGGNNHFLKTAMSIDLSTPYTISMWHRVDRDVNSNGVNCLFSQWGWSTNLASQGRILTSGDISFQTSATGTSTLKNCTTGRRMFKGYEWQHIAFRYDDASDMTETFINGHRVAKLTGVTAVFNSSFEFAIGARGVTGLDDLSGFIEQFAIYNRALTVAEITWIADYNLYGDLT